MVDFYNRDGSPITPRNFTRPTVTATPAAAPRQPVAAPRVQPQTDPAALLRQAVEVFGGATLPTIPGAPGHVEPNPARGAAPAKLDIDAELNTLFKHFDL